MYLWTRNRSEHVAQRSKAESPALMRRATEQQSGPKLSFLLFLLIAWFCTKSVFFLGLAPSISAGVFLTLIAH